MKVDVFNQKGSKTTKSVELADNVFAKFVGEDLLAQYVYVYLSNQRAPIAHTKDRSDVSGGGKKPWRQKGTGRARVGSNRSPIWTGGGVTFGPRNIRNWKKSMPKKMRKAAFKGAFSKLVAAGNVRIVDKIELKDERLTNQAHEIIVGFESPKKALIIVDKSNQNLLNAFANVSSVTVVRAAELNTYDILTGGMIIILEDAIEYLNNKA